MLEPLAAGLQRGALERLPKWLICMPLVLQWLWLSLRYGCATLPSAANPSITAGGLVGETKLEYFRGMGPLATAATARYCALPPAARRSGPGARATMVDAGLTFPLIVKPDLGMCGFGVRLIKDEAALSDYLAGFPDAQQLVMQEYLPQEGEAGIFYARQPGAVCGRIIGLALRYFPQVTGDGISTLAQLIAGDLRARRVQGRTDHMAIPATDRVPAHGEVVRLATIGSTRVGGLYRDGVACITPALTATVDAIARDMPAFFAGRFDVRFEHLGELAAGRGLRIMEVNGAGSEAIQAWDPHSAFSPRSASFSPSSVYCLRLVRPTAGAATSPSACAGWRNCTSCNSACWTPTRRRTDPQPPLP